MKKLNLSIYPTPAEVDALFYLGKANELRWKANHFRSKAGEIVHLHMDKLGTRRIRYWNRKNKKFHLVSPAVIAWMLNTGGLPPERGIFSLHGDNSDFAFGNWLEQDITPPKINADNIKDYVHYNGETGVFTWQFRTPRNSNDRTFLNMNAGKPVLFRLHDGYQVFKIANITRKAHTWAWLYTHGELPGDGFVIDHIDKNPLNNSIENLRVVTQAENCRNTLKYKRKVRKGRTPNKNPYPRTSEVREVYSYDLSKGELYWRKRKAVKASDKRHNTMYAGKKAGRYTEGQPVLVYLNRVRYTAQELIWSYLARPQPKFGIICKNGNKHDLRIDNWFAASPIHDDFQSEKDPFKKQTILKKLLSYNAAQGTFTYRQRELERIGDVSFNQRIKKSKTAGFRRARYHYCTINAKDYHSSHLAWLYVYGVWPPDTGLEIDHINLDPFDNRIANLRLVSHSQNMTNLPLLKSNTSGHPGVIKDSQRKGKWRAYLAHKTIGIFATKQAAIEARQRAENR